MEHNRLRQALHAYRQGDPPAAIDLLQKAVQINPDDASCWELLGTIRRDQEMVAESVAALETAATLKPLSRSSQLALADGYVKLGFAESALCIYEYLADDEGLSARYLPDVIRGFAAVGDFQRALELCREAAGRDPTDDQAAYGMAYYMSKCGYPAELVLPVLCRVVELAPDVERRLYESTLVGR